MYAEPRRLNGRHAPQHPTAEEKTDMGMYFLGLVVLLTFAYLGYALFRPEKF